MLEILQFIFSSFWVFIGSALLLSIVVTGAVKLSLAAAYAVRGGKVEM